MREKNASMIRNALLLGAAGLVGAGIALLLAPQSGVKTRRQLRRRAEDLREDLGECVDNLLEECRAAGGKGLEKGKQATRRLQEDAVKALRASRDQITRRIEQLRHTVSA